MLIIDAKPTTVDGDPLKMVKVLNNLISNAIKFSDVGGHVQISVFSSEARCEIRVSDHGNGIPPDIHAKLFSPFCEGQNGTAGEKTTGLGLYISSRIVEAHGGTIEVDTRLGVGTTFCVALPYQGWGGDRPEDYQHHALSPDDGITLAKFG